MTNAQKTSHRGTESAERPKRSPRPPVLRDAKVKSDLIFDPQATTSRFVAVMEWAIATQKAKDDKDFGTTIGMNGNTIYHYNKPASEGGRVIGPDYAATIKVRYNIPTDYIYCGDTHYIPDDFRVYLSSKSPRRALDQ